MPKVAMGLTSNQPAVLFLWCEITNRELTQFKKNLKFVLVCRLSDKQLRRVYMRFWRDMTYREIAEQEGVAHTSALRCIKTIVKKLHQNAIYRETNGKF